MSEREKDFISRKPISVREKSLVVLMLVALFAVLTVPVAQAARNRELDSELNEIERSVTLLGEQKRVLQSSIAQAKMPEQTLITALWKGLDLRKLMFDEAKIVHVGEQE
jgi:cell division protein FtsL